MASQKLYIFNQAIGSKNGNINNLFINRNIYYIFNIKKQCFFTIFTVLEFVLIKFVSKKYQLLEKVY